MSEWIYHTLDEYIRLGNIELGRGNIISKIDIEKHPGPYPIYSSSAQGNGKFGEYGKFMFDEELISWSVDGGGYFFYRPKHQFSVTNVSGYLRIKTKELGYRFLYYSLALQHRDISFDYTSKAHPSVIKKLYSVPSIPKPEQDRIAEILSTLDEAIAQTEALIAKHQQIKAGLMHDLFTYGVTPDGHLRPTREQAPDLYKESPLGWIPKEWEVVSLGEISHSMTNGFVGTATPFYSEDADSVPYLYGNNIRADRLELPTSLRVTRRFHLAQSKSQLSPGDMLTVQSGHIGTSAIVPTELGEANCHALIITKLKTNRVIPGFVSFYCNSTDGFNRLGSIFVGSTIMHINVKEFKNFTIPLPCDLAEQERICTRLVCTISRIDSGTENLDKLRQQKHGLMHDLLTGRVRVLEHLGQKYAEAIG